MPCREITQIIRVPDLGASPAMVNRETGVMYISMKHMAALPPEHRLFVMLHEMGHVVLQTTDEYEADAWAFKKYAEMGYSLTASVKALTRILNDSNPEHAWRMYLQLERAKEYDYRVNNNTKVYQDETR